MRFLLSILLFFALVSAAAATESSDVVGRWKARDKDIVMTVARDGARDTGTVDGKIVLRVTYDPAGVWRGEIFAPKKNAFVPATMKIKDGVLIITAGSGLFTKDIHWARV
jgi:hypothetical protein